MLRATPGDIDVHRFEENLERGRQANAAGNPTEALAALDSALDLWRGPALADVADEPFLLRRSAAARRAAADRAGGTVRRTSLRSVSTTDSWPSSTRSSNAIRFGSVCGRN